MVRKVGNAELTVLTHAWLTRAVILKPLSLLLMDSIKPNLLYNKVGAMHVNTTRSKKIMRLHHWRYEDNLPLKFVTGMVNQCLNTSYTIEKVKRVCEKSG